MHKAQRLGMQHLTRANRKTVVYKLTVLCRVQPLQDLITPIPLITKERMTQMAHVGTDLMSTPRLQHTLHQRRIAKAFQHMVMSHSTPPNLRPRRKNRHPHPIPRITSDVALYPTILLHKIAPHQRMILASGRFIEKLKSQVRLRHSCLRHHQQSARILVNAVYQTNLRIIDVILRHILQVPRNGIQHRAVPVAKAWMDHHACRFVNDHQVLILIHDIQRNLLWRNLILIMRAVQHHLNYIVRLHLVRPLHRLSIRHDKTCVCSTLNPIAARVAQVVQQETVHPQQLLLLVSHHPVVLIQLRGLLVLQTILQHHIRLKFEFFHIHQSHQSSMSKFSPAPSSPSPSRPSYSKSSYSTKAESTSPPPTTKVSGLVRGTDWPAATLLPPCFTPITKSLGLPATCS